MAGVGMVEVLIALLVLSIGILGLAQLQGVATRQTYNGYLRSRATFLAYDIADRIRSNQAQAQAYSISLSDTAPAGNDRARTDLRRWLETLSHQLPLGDGAIARNGDIYTISIQYSTPDSHADDNKHAANVASISFQTRIAP